MTWRQTTISPKTDRIQQSLSQITQVRTQNIRLKIQLQKSKSQMQPLKQQIQKLNKIIDQYEQRQSKINNFLTRISIILGTGSTDKYRRKDKNKQREKQKDKDNTDELLEILQQIQRKVLDQKQSYRKLQKSLQKGHSAQMIQNLQSQIQLLKSKLKQYEQSFLQTSQKLRLILAQNTKLKQQSQQKSTSLAQLTHKITNFQICLKDKQQQIKQLQSANISMNGQKCKKQCIELLSQINVRDDDYLKSYLLKNYRFQNGQAGTNTILRKNKYQFIFQQ